MSMFCRQCEQTFRGVGCDKLGVCGKEPDVANLQDLLIHALKGLAVYGKMAREIGLKDASRDLFLMEGVFATLTNVNFDPQVMEDLIYQTAKKTKELKQTFEGLPAEIQGAV